MAGLQLNTVDSLRRSVKSGAEVVQDIEQLYDQLAEELVAVFYAYCCDALLAQDALQECFLRLQRQRNVGAIRNTRAWLLKVGRNWIRAERRRYGRLQFDAGNLDSRSGDTADPHDLAAAIEQNSVIRSAFSELSLADRELLVLRYSLAWNSKRIAETVGIASSAVDMRLSRARARLGVALSRKGVDREST